MLCVYAVKLLIGLHEIVVISYYWLVVGSKPFDSENVSELINKIIHVEVPPPAVRGSRLSAKPSPDLVDLLNGLLHKDPGDRYVDYNV